MCETDSEIGTEFGTGNEEAGRLSFYYSILYGVMMDNSAPFVPGVSINYMGKKDLLYPGNLADIATCFGIYQFECKYSAQASRFKLVVGDKKVHSVLSIIPDDSFSPKQTDIRSLVWRFVKNQAKRISEMEVCMIVHNTETGEKEIIIAAFTSAAK